jgi:hypothetical protein
MVSCNKIAIRRPIPNPLPAVGFSEFKNVAHSKPRKEMVGIPIIRRS